MEDFSLDIVARKSVKSIVALTSRTFFIQLLGVAASFILAVYLSPTDFGIFFIVSSLVIFLNYFSDIGLAASLIQKKEDPTSEEFKTVFTAQQILVLLIIIPAFFLSPTIASFFHLNTDGHILLIAFLISFLLSSLKTIPTIILERKLDFHKLIIPQIGENLVYNVILIVFAVQGFGIKSFTIAVLSRGVVGLFLMYLVSPWKIGLYFDLKIFRKLMSFGIPFQLNSLLALTKDNLINIYIGKALPLAQVGYIGFAQKWAFMPISLVLENVNKVIFPSFSRLQHDKEALSKVLEKSLFMIAFFFFPTAFAFIILSPYLIEFIPQYNKWEPAIISIAFFSLNIVFGSLTSPLTNFLNAIGKVKTTLYLMVFWTTMTWILTPVLIKALGYNGVSIASFIVAFSTLISLIFVKKYLDFSFISPIYKQFIAALFMVGFIFFTQSLIRSLPILVFEIFLSAIFYIAILFLISKKEMRSAIRFVMHNLK